MRETFDIRSEASYAPEGVFREGLLYLSGKPVDYYPWQAQGLPTDKPLQVVMLYWGEFAPLAQVLNAWLGARAMALPTAC